MKTWRSFRMEKVPKSSTSKSKDSPSLTHEHQGAGNKYKGKTTPEIHHGQKALKCLEILFFLFLTKDILKGI